MASSDKPPPRDPDVLSVAPDHRPSDAQPQWRKDFPIDGPADGFVARREFVKFMTLISGAFVAGQGWVAASSLVRKKQTTSDHRKVTSLSSLAPGSAMVFRYPGEHDPCLLIRDHEGHLFAYSQLCTHLSCAVIPDVDAGLLRCPCHEGFFDLKTGRNVAGPPPRPLPRILLEQRGDDVYAVGVEKRTV